MKNLGRRPRCPNCSALDPNSVGLNWRCKVCGRSWLKNPQNKIKHICKNRPTKCIYCQEVGTVVGNGLCWKCTECGRSWAKHPVVKNLEERPPCPVCRGRPKSSGTSWACTKCGKEWRKVYFNAPKLSIIDLISAKVIEI